MGDKPIWEQIGSSFVQHYYQLFDADRTQLGAIYIDASCLTWEGQQFQGKAAIVEKLSSLPFQKIQHSITAQDHQPTPDSCILSMVVGQLKAVPGQGKLEVLCGCLDLFWESCLQSCSSGNVVDADSYRNSEVQQLQTALGGPWLMKTLSWDSTRYFY
ncbi:nuclear transport factor 2 isoform 1-T3 [Phaethornis superciliosus]